MKSVFIVSLVFVSLLGKAQICVYQLPDSTEVQQFKLISLIHGDTLNLEQCFHLPDDWKTAIIQAESYLPYKLSRFESVSKVYLVPKGLKQFALNAIDIRPLELAIDAEKQSAPIAELSHEQIEELSYNEGMVHALNTIPGVRMEQRSTGSYRINSRGSILRSPYGVRNFKTYVNGIPMTDALGNTYLNLLSPQLFRSMQLVRGPAGAIYGNGLGGTLLLNARDFSNGLSADLGLRLGSFNTAGATSHILHGKSNRNLQAFINHTETKGYRDHSALKRTQAYFQVDYAPNEKRKSKLSFMLLASSLDYKLTGGLTREQFEENPRQARQLAVDRNASIDQLNAMFGLRRQKKQKTSKGGRIAEQTVFASIGEKLNPFISNYEDELNFNGGFRNVYGWHGEKNDWRWQIQSGVEGQWSFLRASNYENDGGEKGAYRFRDESNVAYLQAFAQAHIQKDAMSLNASLGTSLSGFSLNRFDNNLNNAPGYERFYQPPILPRLGINYELSEKSVLWASISRGFSNPLLDEVRNNAGEINRQLQPESGLSLDIGYRSVGSRLITWDITAFYMEQQKLIVSRLDELGAAIYRNAGSTQQLGLESRFEMDIQRLLQLPFNMYWAHSLTVNNFTFQEYEQLANDELRDFSGNSLPGTAPVMYVQQLNVEKKSFAINFFANYTESMFLNNANSVKSKAYWLLNLQLSKTLKRNKKEVRISIACENLSDTDYSLGNDLNAFGGRYFNPAPSRSYFLKVNYSINR